MAVRFNATTEYLSSTAGMPSTTAFTAMGWSYHITDTDAFSTNWTFGSESGYGADFIWMGTIGNGTTWNLDRSGQVSIDFSSQPGLNQWFHWFVKSSGTGVGELSAGWRHVGDTSYNIVTRTGLSATMTVMEMGGDTSSLLLNSRMAAFKLFDVHKSTAVILTESPFYTPLDTANINRWTPLLAHTDLTDHGPNSYDWTGNGTLSTESGPPITWAPGSRAQTHYRRRRAA